MKQLGGNLPNGSEVFVIGGGPAGIAAALAARLHGLEVTVADSLQPPIDKPCGEGLMPDGIVSLQRLGVNIPIIAAHRFRGIRFISSGLAVEASFPSGFGLGVRRTHLHQLMVEHALAMGVRFRWGAVVTGIDSEGVLLQGKRCPARWIVGADGSASRVRRWAGLDRHRKKLQRFAFRRHYGIAPWNEFMELHWGDKCQLYVTPVSAEEVCVALISRNPALRLDEALPGFPAIEERVKGAAHGSVERGAVSLTRRLQRVCTERVALIGDSSGSVDAITGEGLCLAFNQAHALGECLAAGSLSSYQAAHQKLAVRPGTMARIMLTLEDRDRLRSRVMRAFVREPKLFARMLAVHVGAVSASDLVTGAISLGWKMGIL